MERNPCTTWITIFDPCSSLGFGVGAEGDAATGEVGAVGPPGGGGIVGEAAAIELNLCPRLLPRLALAHLGTANSRAAGFAKGLLLSHLGPRHTRVRHVGFQGESMSALAAHAPAG
jgi:hypothetical protein